MKTLLGLLLIATLLGRCGHQTSHHGLTWSHAVDSLLRDTTSINTMADEARRRVNSANTDTTALMHLAELAQQIRSPIALEIANEAFATSRSIGFEAGVADALCRQGIYHLRSGMQPTADSLFAQSLRHSRALPGKQGAQLQAQAHFWRGELKRMTGDAASAFSAYDSCLAGARLANDEKRIATCLGVIGVTYLFQGQLDSATRKLEEALVLARSINDLERMAFCLASLGDVRRMSNDHKGAIGMYEQALEMAAQLNDRNRMAYAYGSIGDIHRLNSELPDALAMFAKQRELGKEMGDTRTMASTSFSMGEMFRRLENNTEALKSYQEGLRHATAAEMYTAMGACHYGIGQIHAAEGRNEEALAEYDAALRIGEQTGFTSLLVSVHNEIGEMLATEDGDRSVAREHFLKAASLARTTGDPGLAVSLRRLGEMSLRSGSHKEALALGSEALRAAQEMGAQPLEMSNITKLLHQVHDSLGAAAASLAMLKLHNQWADSLRLKQDKERFLAANYDAKEQTLKAEHEKERALAEHRIDEQRRQKRAFLSIGSLTLAIAALLAWLLISTRRKNQAILAAQQQVVEAEKQRENESVRTRIARDIHDDIGSGLTKIAMLSNEAKHKVQVHAEELHATLDRITTHSRTVSAALSDIVWSVDPAQDSSAELVHHAGHVAHRLLDDAGMRHELSFEHTEPGHPVSPSAKHHVVMVMKEAINNALKYAEAQRITVRLTAGAGRFELLVQDDGKGFDPKAMSRSGNGLRNMQARAEALGARLDVRSAPGQGCAVRLEGTLA